MSETLYQKIEWNQEAEVNCWELFHENAKTGRFDKALTNEQVVAEMKNVYESFPYQNKKAIPLPDTLTPVNGSFEEIVLKRKTTARCKPVNITQEQLRTILHFGYGETRDNKHDEYISRPFRTVPSGGALYPLELYFFSNGHVEGLEAGLYHYSPIFNAVHLIKKGDFRKEIGATLVEFQSNLAFDLSVIVFITAVFQRSIFKYREKGYRFALMEAGHVSQNINLTATGLQFGVINIGGYYDREIDHFLEIDGLRHSTIYMTGIGGSNE
jgi:SagB-type dehydrogenase family enzyme